MQKVKGYILAFLLIAAFTGNAQEVSSIIFNAKTAMEQQDFYSAAAIAKKGLDKVSDHSSANYKILVDVFIEANMYVGNLEVAESYLDDHIAFLTKKYGSKDTSLVSYIAGKGGIAYMRGFYSDAINYFEESSRLLEENKLQKTEDYAAIQSNVGMLYAQIGELNKALIPLENAQYFFENDTDAYVYELSLVYNNLGDAYQSKYEYRKAESFYRKSLAMFELLGDASSADYINTFGNYALLKLETGKKEEAVEALLKNKALIELHLGKDSEEYAIALNNLGQAYDQMGNYALSEEYLLEAFKLKSQLYDKWHPSMMVSMNNLAMFYYELGKLDMAELYMQQLISLQKEYHKENIEKLILYTNNLSVIYKAKNELKKSQKAAKEVVELVEEREGKTTVNYFSALSGYSVALMEEDEDLPEAKTQLYYLAKIYPKLKDELPYEDKIAFWNNKGAVEMYLGEHAEAERSFKQGTALVSEQFGEQHPDYLLFESNMAYNYKLEGKVEEAYTPLVNSANKELKNVKALFPTLTEIEKELYIQKTTPTLQHFYVFALKNKDKLPQAIGAMANLRLETKSLVMRTSDNMRKAIVTSGNQALKEEYEAWLAAKKELAKHKTLTKKELKSLGVDIQAEEAKVEQLEKTLLKNSASIVRLEDKVDWKKIAQKLAPNEAAIEVVRVKDDFYQQSKTIFYVFLIIKNGQQQPEMIVLENGVELERKHYKYYRNSIGYKTKSSKPYQAYWQPISSSLKGVKKVYVSSDGIYHKINLNTLFNEETGQYLLQELQIENRASLNSLVGNIETEATKNICLFGHPNYYLDLEEALNNYSHGMAPKARTVRVDQVVWTDLPGTKEEVQTIGQLLQGKSWNVKLYTEEEAIENRIKNLKKTDILHIATHGFFEPTVEDTISMYSAAYFTSPLLKSGLAFSGAGVPLEPGQLEDISYYEDGILYANEVLSMSLDARCVILSACETGLGEVRNQEGVYGLQRAFLIAGADAVIMSLWTVDDAATKDLMIAFYNYYYGSQELENSFYKAMKDMQEKYKDPVYWGAFVLMKK